jgi:PAB1-binding protein PBP1
VSKVSLDQLGQGVKNTNFDQYRNVKSTYDESLYTVGYDESKLTEEQKQLADRVSKEIEGSDSKGNLAMALERGQLNQGDFDDEELLYGTGITSL